MLKNTIHASLSANSNSEAWISCEYLIGKIDAYYDSWMTFLQVVPPEIKVPILKSVIGTCGETGILVEAP